MVPELGEGEHFPVKEEGAGSNPVGAVVVLRVVLPPRCSNGRAPVYEAGLCRFESCRGD